MTGTFLTEAQWNQIGCQLKGKSNIRELVIDKEIETGNAVVRFVGADGMFVKNLRGNVVQFPIKNSPKTAKAIRFFNLIVEIAKKVGLEIGFVLCIIDPPEEDEGGSDA